MALNRRGPKKHLKKGGDFSLHDENYFRYLDFQMHSDAETLANFWNWKLMLKKEQPRSSIKDVMDHTADGRHPE